QSLAARWDPKRGVLRTSGLCVLRRCLPPRLGSQRAASDCRRVELDRSTPILGRYDLPDWICGTEGMAFNGAIRLASGSTAPEFSMRDSAVYGSEPVLCQEPRSDERRVG